MSAAAIVLFHQNKAIQALHLARAVTPEASVRLDDVGIRLSRLVRWLIRYGVLVGVGSVRFYLDRAGEHQLYRRRRVIFAILFALFAVSMVVVMW